MVETASAATTAFRVPRPTTGDLPPGSAAPGRRSGRHRPRSRRAPRGGVASSSTSSRASTPASARRACASSTSSLPGSTTPPVICVSKDLPSRSVAVGAEGIENVTAASAFRSDFGTDYGVTMTDGPPRRAAGSRWSSSTRPARSSQPTRPRDHHRADYDAAVAAQLSPRKASGSVVCMPSTRRTLWFAPGSGTLVRRDDDLDALEFPLGRCTPSSPSPDAAPRPGWSCHRRCGSDRRGSAPGCPPNRPRRARRAAGRRGAPQGPVETPDQVPQWIVRAQHRA